jgi:mycothiol S-conjugate amidase
MRILALHAHPDDESSKGAGTVARYAADGARAVLVTATGGEAGDILNPAMDRPEVAARLAEIRAEELETAAAILGYAEIVMLGYRDSGMPETDDNGHPDAFVNADPEEALGALVAIARSERPEVVLGYDDHERYPHPDHLRVHDLSLELFDAAADGDRFPDAGPPWEIAKLYAPVFTARRILSLHRAMEERGLESPFTRWVGVIDETREDDRRLTRIDVGEYVETARDALRAHRTQVDPEGFWFQVPTEVVRTVYPYEDFELLRSRVGWQEGEEDLFAGIEPGIAEKHAP